MVLIIVLALILGLSCRWNKLSFNVYYSGHEDHTRMRNGDRPVPSWAMDLWPGQWIPRQHKNYPIRLINCGRKSNTKKNRRAGIISHCLANNNNNKRPPSWQVDNIYIKILVYKIEQNRFHLRNYSD